jgi:CubicO group peptidase (beta-lactamase class C family)
MKSAYILCLLLLIGAMAFTQPAGRLDSLFTTLYKLDQFTGSVLVSEKGKTIYQQSFGADNQHKTVYTLGSIAKTLTSTAILRCKQTGLLNLDDPVSKHLPQFPYPSITIRHLLTHTSGLPDYNLYEQEMKQNPGKIFTNSDLIPALLTWNTPLKFQPGEKWQYSNTNYSLLALVIEKVSMRSFETYMQKNIFKRARMTQTYFQSDPLRTKDSNRTQNHEYPFLFSTNLEPSDSLQKNRWRSFNMSGFVGQGNIMTTTNDLLRFDEALYAGILLNPKSLEEAFTPYRLNNGEFVNAQSGIGKASYGLGWFIMTDSSAGKIVWHSGGVPGGLSIFLRNITHQNTVIAFDNHFGTNLYRHGMNAMNILTKQPLVNRKISLVRHYALVLSAKGPDYALAILNHFRADTTNYVLVEDDMNELGLQLLYAAKYKAHTEHALAVLKQNTIWFPDAFNTYDSYGEALAFTGDKQRAILMYKRSIELNPKNEGGKQALDRLLH